MGRCQRTDAADACYGPCHGCAKGKESDPEESIKAAVKYLKAVEQIFLKVKDEKERVKFVLAAYNAD